VAKEFGEDMALTLIFLVLGSLGAETVYLPLASARGFAPGPDGMLMTQVYKPQNGRVRLVLEKPAGSFHFEALRGGPYRLMAFGTFGKKQEETTRYTTREFSISGVKTAASRIDPDARNSRWVEWGTFDLSPGCYELRSGELSPKAGGGGPQADGAAPSGSEKDAKDTLGGEDLEEEIDGTEGGKFTTSPLGLPQVAEIVTGPCLPRNLAKWGSLRVKGDLAKAKVVQEVSTDGGASWQALQGSDLSRLPVSAGIRVRLRVTALGNQPCAVSALSVSFERKAEDLLSLSGKDYRLELTRQGRLAGVYHRENRIGDFTRSDLFGVRLRVAKGQNPDVSAQDFELKELSEKPDGLLLRFVKTDPTLEAQVEVRKGGEELSYWTLTVRNSSSHAIELVRFPTLGPLALHRGLHQPPTPMLPESLWGAGEEGSFPGNMSMGWSCWQGEPGSVFLASLDPTWTQVVFSLPLRNGLASISTASQRVIPPGESFRFPYALGIYQGDWHRAADWYQELSRSFIKPPEHPRWAKYADGWYLGSAEDLCYGRRSVTSFPDARWIGLNYCQTWYTGDGEFVGNFGYCSPTLGTPEQHRLDAKRMAESGGHSGYYIQDQEFVIDHARSKTHIGNTRKALFPAWTFIPTESWYEESSIRGADGSPRQWASQMSSYTVTEMRYMCLGSEGWRKYIVDAVRSNVQHYGCSTQYIDQLSCTTQNCWNAKHEHGFQYGFHGPNSVRVAREVVEACRKVDPDFALAAEGMSCLTGQFVNFHLASSRPYRDHGSNFLYTFPDALIFRGTANGCFQWTGLSMEQHLRDMYLFHRYDFCHLSPLMREIILLRQRIKDWMYEARFMDDVGLSCEPKDCRAKWFARKGIDVSGALINFRTSADNVSPDIELKAPDLLSPDTRSFLYLEGGTVEPIQAEFAAGTARFKFGPLPKTVGTILAVKSCAAKEALRPYCFQDMAPGPDRLVVRAANAGTKPIEGTWRIECDLALKLEKREGPFAIEPGKTLSLAVGIPELWKQQQRHDLKVVFAAPAENARYECTAIVAPPLVNGGFEADSNQTGCPDHWWSRSNSIVHQVIRHSDDFLGYDLLAKLDGENPAEGRKCLRLDAAARYRLTRGERARKHALWVESNQIQGEEASLYDTWPFTTSQMLILKPSSIYRLSFRTRCGDLEAKGQVSCPYGSNMEVRDQSGDGQWREERMTIRTPVILPEYPLLTFSGDPTAGKPHRIWVDDVQVLSAGPARSTEAP
jgi:hypothetical protein